MGFERGSHAPGQLVENHLPDVVTVVLIVGPGVPEPNYQIQLITQQLGLSLLRLPWSLRP